MAEVTIEQHYHGCEGCGNPIALFYSHGGRKASGCKDLTQKTPYCWECDAPRFSAVNVAYADRNSRNPDYIHGQAATRINMETPNCRIAIESLRLFVGVPACDCCKMCFGSNITSCRHCGAHSVAKDQHCENCSYLGNVTAVHHTRMGAHAVCDSCLRRVGCDCNRCADVRGHPVPYLFEFWRDARISEIMGLPFPKWPVTLDYSEERREIRNYHTKLAAALLRTKKKSVVNDFLTLADEW